MFLSVVGKSTSRDAFNNPNLVNVQKKNREIMLHLSVEVLLKGRGA